MMSSEYKTGETHEEVSRRWAREHIERSPDVVFTARYRRFAYGVEPEVAAKTLEQELREQFT